jgi:hypothetical protein
VLLEKLAEGTAMPSKKKKHPTQKPATPKWEFGSDIPTHDFVEKDSLNALCAQARANHVRVAICCFYLPASAFRDSAPSPATLTVNRKRSIDLRLAWRRQRFGNRDRPSAGGNIGWPIKHLVGRSGLPLYVYTSPIRSSPISRIVECRS